LSVRCFDAAGHSRCEPLLRLTQFPVGELDTLVRDGHAYVPWRISSDFRNSFVPKIAGKPPSDVHFGDVYAPGTRQNKPNKPGLFRFWVARGFDTTPFPDGDYRLDVEAADVRGNASRGHLVLTFVNEEREL